jgi:hypothetical protein
LILLMRILPLLICCLLFVACANEEAGNARVSTDSTSSPQTVIPAGAQTAAPRGPEVEHFSFTDEVRKVIDGAGCIFNARGVTGDSSLFASSSDGVIRVAGKIQVLGFVGEGESTDSLSELRFENTHYRVNLRTVTDSMIEGGTAQHGEMTVEDKSNGERTTLALVGGCGC